MCINWPNPKGEQRNQNERNNMKQTVNFYDFCDAWRIHGRNDSFSYDGKKALWEWLEQWEDDCGEEIELDVIALDCDYSEHASALDFVNDSGYSDWMTVDDQNDALRAHVEEEDPVDHDKRFLELVREPAEVLEPLALEWLRENTQVIEFDGGIIIQSF